MVKMIGLLLIISSLLALAVGAFVDWKFGSAVDVTGNVVFNIVTQPEIKTSLIDYIEAVAFSYSIASFIMGVVFLIKM